MLAMLPALTLQYWGDFPSPPPVLSFCFHGFNVRAIDMYVL